MNEETPPRGSMDWRQMLIHAPADDEGDDEQTTALTAMDVPNVLEDLKRYLSNLIAQVGPGCSEDAFFAAAGFVEVFKRFAKVADGAFKNNAKAKINSDGDMRLGELRWYVGVKKKIVVDSIPATVVHLFHDVGDTPEQMLADAGGDMDEFSKRLDAKLLLVCDFISSSTSTLKQGAIKKAIPEVFSAHFSEEQVEKLEVSGLPKTKKAAPKLDENGNPEPTLQKFDARFVR